MKRYENTTLITGSVEGRQIDDVLIVDRSPEGNRRIIMARDARLEQSPSQPGVVSLALDNVFTQLSYPKEGDRYDYTLSDSMVYYDTSEEHLERHHWRPDAVLHELRRRLEADHPQIG